MALLLLLQFLIIILNKIEYVFDIFNVFGNYILDKDSLAKLCEFYN